MIITDEKALRVQCVDALPHEIGPLIEQLERELDYSARMGRAGIGLAAPQIGIAKNVAIVRVDKQPKINLVNCKVVAGYDQELFEEEGCLSFPDKFEKTLRYQEIVVEGNAVYPLRFVTTGLVAVVVQHELDHLVGKLLPDFALPKLDKKKIRPNDKCICGSLKKYKKCCGDK